MSGTGAAPPEARIRSTVIERADGGRIGRIAVDNRAKLNIVDRRLCAELRDTVRAFGQEAELRALVLTGAGDRAFIGGADIGELATLDPATAADFIRTLHEACAALRSAPVPVIARISGYCLGAGLEVAASCDLRIAASDARFGMPEVRVGIPSVIEAALLPGLIGWGKTREMLFTGAIFDAAEMLASGLIEKVVDGAALDGAVEVWLDAIAAAGPAAIRAQKRLIGEWQRLALEDAIEAGVTALADAYRTDEPRRMMTAFLNRKR